MKKFHISSKFTPLDSIRYEDTEVLIKRDDLNQLGCSKQRSIPYLINEYLNMGKNKFVVSSSGNSGLVSAYCALNSSEIVEMHIFLSENISDQKLKKYIDKLGLNTSIDNLRNNTYKIKNLVIELVNNPRQEAFNLSKKGFVNLRGSTDDLALVGFESFVHEIISQTTTKIESVFVPSSSGATALGIYNGFKSCNQNPRMNIVQTTKINALVKNIAVSHITESNHPAESIVDYIGHRRKDIEKIVYDSQGKGWIISSKEIQKAKNILINQYNIDASYDSSLSFAAFLKADNKKNCLLVFTG